MKKLLTLLLALAMVISMFAFVSCNNDDTPEEPDTPNTPDTPVTPEEPETPVDPDPDTPVDPDPDTPVDPDPDTPVDPDPDTPVDPDPDTPVDPDPDTPVDPDPDTPAVPTEPTAVMYFSQGKIDGWINDTKVNSEGPTYDATLGGVKFVYTGVAGPNGGYQEGDNGFKTIYKVKENGTGKEEIDISMMSHFVFDLYVSDVTNFAPVNFYIELTSSNTCDKEESGIRTQLGAFVEGGLKNGWNHVEIPFASLTSTACDLTAWDYFRIFNADSFDRGEGLTVAFNNFGFLTYDPNVVLPEDPDQPDTPDEPDVPVEPVEPSEEGQGTVNPDSTLVPDVSDIIPDVPEVEDVKPGTVTPSQNEAAMGGSWDGPIVVTPDGVTTPVLPIA